MFHKLSRATLTDQIVQSLLEYIEAAGLRPGDVLPSENRLAAEFGVSRPVVREALKVLAGQDIVDVIAGKGAVIRPIDSGVLQSFFERAIGLNGSALPQLLEVRSGLEMYSAQVVAERCTGEDLVDLRQIVAEMRVCMGDREAYAQLDLQFHMRLAQASGNRMLYHLMESVGGALQASMVDSYRPERSGQTIEEIQRLHETVMDELERRDGLAARMAMARHFDPVLP
jgi:GntR family transcriptional regulator, transcriptional repressor for pyruvate dehydrogenase complex